MLHSSTSPNTNTHAHSLTLLATLQSQFSTVLGSSSCVWNISISALHPHQKKPNQISLPMPPHDHFSARIIPPHPLLCPLLHHSDQLDHNSLRLLWAIVCKIVCLFWCCLMRAKSGPFYAVTHVKYPGKRKHPRRLWWVSSKDFLGKLHAAFFVGAKPNLNVLSEKERKDFVSFWAFCATILV